MVPTVVRSQASQDPPQDSGTESPGVNTAVHAEGRGDLAEAACQSHTGNLELTLFRQCLRVRGWETSLGVTSKELGLEPF